MTPRPDIEGILSRFREWLSQTDAQVVPDCQSASGGDKIAGDAVGLWDVVREFTALRHEVKLQTKSSRSLEEQTAAAVQALREAATRLRQIESDESRSAERAAMPLVEAMADLDEALERGRAAMESACRRLAELWTVEFERRLELLASAQPFWKRWLCRGWQQAIGDIVRETDEAQRRILESLADGYLLVGGRLQRAMGREGLERIRCVGEPVDPHLMTVVEAVESADQPTGIVLDEIRPGYVWNGRVLRFAEVRVSASRSGVGPAAESRPARLDGRDTQFMQDL